MRYFYFHFTEKMLKLDMLRNLFTDNQFLIAKGGPGYGTVRLPVFFTILWGLFIIPERFE